MVVATVLFFLDQWHEVPTTTWYPLAFHLFVVRVGELPGVPVSTVMFGPVVECALLDEATLFKVATVGVVLVVPATRFVNFVLGATAPRPTEVGATSSARLVLCPSIPVRTHPGQVTLWQVGAVVGYVSAVENTSTRSGAHQIYLRPFGAVVVHTSLRWQATRTRGVFLAAHQAPRNELPRWPALPTRGPDLGVGASVWPPFHLRAMGVLGWTKATHALLGVSPK